MLQHPDRDKWCSWLDRISDELIASGVDQHVFKCWWTTINANKAIDVNNTFIALIWASYFDRQILTIRRQLDCDKQAISLVRLMREVASYAGQLHREDFLKAYTRREYTEEWQAADELFSNFTDPSKPNSVSKDVVNAQIDDLKNASSDLLDLADKWLAHSDRNRQWPNLGFDKLNGCLDLLYTTWHRYHELAAIGPHEADFEYLAGSEWEAILDIPFRS